MLSYETFGKKVKTMHFIGYESHIDTPLIFDRIQNWCFKPYTNSFLQNPYKISLKQNICVCLKSFCTLSISFCKNALFYARTLMLKSALCAILFIYFHSLHKYLKKSLRKQKIAMKILNTLQCKSKKKLHCSGMK